MFTSFKETLLSVTKNVTFTTPVTNQNDQKVSSNVGSEILKHYQTAWEEIHEINEANAKAANQISKCIEIFERKIQLDRKNMEQIMHMLTNNLKPALKTCNKELEELSSYFTVVEDDLLELENVIDELELENAKRTNKSRLNQYKLRKFDDYEHLEKSLEENFQKVVHQHDELEKRKLEERQKVFQEAFKNDLEQYKILGSVPKIAINKSPSALLEEIQIDQDTSELNNFLENDS